MKNKKYFFSLFALISIIAIIAISCGKSSDNSTPYPPAGGGGAAPNAVSINGMSFSPKTLTVAKGTIVKWTNNDSYSSHTVTSNDGTSFDSKTISGGGVYSYTAITAGTFEYHCTIHGMAMSGTLIVNP